MKPKVLHIMDSMGVGGAPTVVKRYFEENSENRNIFFFALRKAEVNLTIKHRNILVYDSTSRFSLVPLFLLLKLIKKEGIDILHCHLFRSKVYGWIIKFFFFPRIGLIFHEHGEVMEGKGYYRRFLKIAGRRINLHIAVSEISKRMLIEKESVPGENIRVLYNAVDLNRFNGRFFSNQEEVLKQKAAYGIGPGFFVIGFVGRLIQAKGCEYLIRALPCLAFDFKLIIVGEGPFRIRLEEIVHELKLRGHVIFLGSVEDVVKVYSVLDVMIVPSLAESFGLPVIEAKAMGVPVVASRVSGLSEIIQDGKDGLLFEAGNVTDLAGKIQLIHENSPLRESLIENALKDVAKYGLKNHIEQLESIYGQFVFAP